MDEGTVLLHQDDPPGRRLRLGRGAWRWRPSPPRARGSALRTLRPGVVVGEIALYTGVPRTADVVAEAPSVVLRISREAIARIEAEEPELAAALHRWLATTLAERLTDTMRSRGHPARLSAPLRERKERSQRGSWGFVAPAPRGQDEATS